MLREVNLYIPFEGGSLGRAPSTFDWVDKHTYRFLDMFEFNALRNVVDMFISKFPTMDTIAARDAVSPIDASWAASREVAKVAEFVFYEDPSEERSMVRDDVEFYLPGSHRHSLRAFSRTFRSMPSSKSIVTTKEQIVSISRLYNPGNWSQSYVNLFVEDDYARHSLQGPDRVSSVSSHGTTAAPACNCLLH